MQPVGYVLKIKNLTLTAQYQPERLDTDGWWSVLLNNLTICLMVNQNGSLSALCFCSQRIQDSSSISSSWSKPKGAGCPQGVSISSPGVRAPEHVSQMGWCECHYFYLFLQSPNVLAPCWIRCVQLVALRRSAGCWMIGLWVWQAFSPKVQGRTWQPTEVQVPRRQCFFWHQEKLSKIPADSRSWSWRHWFSAIFSQAMGQRWQWVWEVNSSRKG
jgi:hypothetical protein